MEGIISERKPERKPPNQTTLAVSRFYSEGPLPAALPRLLDREGHVARVFEPGSESVVIEVALVSEAGGLDFADQRLFERHSTFDEVEAVFSRTRT